jgi:ribosomal protein S18 acetylase RimI-like enzyme
MLENAAVPSVRLLSRVDLPAAIEVLTRAFEDDPLMRYVFANATAPYEECLRELFRFSCEVRLLLGWPLFGSFAHDQLAGVAGVTEPEEKAWPPSLQAVYEQMKAVVGPLASGHMEEYSSHADQFRPQASHYHMGVLGVAPQAQGSGHGRALLDAVQHLSEQHPHSTGVWLDTENPQSAAFYQHCGYEIVAQTMYGTVDVWCLFRPNRPTTNGE